MSDLFERLTLDHLEAIASQKDTDEVFFVGFHNQHSPVMRMTDPCYAPDVWCAHTVDNVRPGAFAAGILQEACDIFGPGEMTHGMLVLIHEDWLAEVELLSDLHWEETDMMGVDAGMTGVFDEARYAEYYQKHVADHDAWCAMLQPQFEEETIYEDKGDPPQQQPDEDYLEYLERCRPYFTPSVIGRKPLTREARGRGMQVTEYGVFCGTSYGDGTFPCLVGRDIEGKVVAVVHDYLDEDEEIEDEAVMSELEGVV